MDPKDETRPAVIEAEIVEPAQPSAAVEPERDLLAAALRSLKSPNTRRAYEGHWRRFAASNDMAPGKFVAAFLSLHKADALDLVHEWRDEMEDDGKSVNTIASALRAVTSMVHRWHMAEIAPWTLKGLIQAPTPDKYTDVTGVSEAGMEAMLSVTEAIGTGESRRDLAILLLLHDSALRRREVCSLDIVHWNADKRIVRVWPKGRARGIRQPQPVSERGAAAISAWLESRGDLPGPLLCQWPIRDGMPEAINGDHVRSIVDRAKRSAGLDEPVSPHRLRHAGITYLARRGVDPNALRAFARHQSFDTTLIYIQNADDTVSKLVGVFDGDAGEDSGEDEDDQ